MNITGTKITPSTRFHQARQAQEQSTESKPSGGPDQQPDRMDFQDASLYLAEAAGRTEYKAETLFKESETLAQARKREVRWGAACLVGAAGLALYSATQGEWGETIGSLTDGRAAALGSLMLGTGGTSLLIENRFQNSEISLGKSVQAREEAQLLRESSQTMAAWGNLL